MQAESSSNKSANQIKYICLLYVVFVRFSPTGCYPLRIFAVKYKAQIAKKLFAFCGKPRKQTGKTAKKENEY